MKEHEVFQIIEKRIISLQQAKQKVVRLAINGIEGTGKTVFSNNLTNYLNEYGFKAVHVSIDGFHNVKNMRYQQGKNSAKGYYEDAYNDNAFIEKVLIASQSESPYYVPLIHDIDTDEVKEPIPLNITQQHIIVSDGAYLFKNIFKDYWDLKIYLQTDFYTVMERGIQRDIDLLGGYKAAKEKYEQRYHKASQMYMLDIRPAEIADLIIDNTDFENLKIIKDTDYSQ